MKASIILMISTLTSISVAPEVFAQETPAPPPANLAVNKQGETSVGIDFSPEAGSIEKGVDVPGQPILTFTRIADTSTPIPEGDGNFTGFESDEAVVAGNEVVFSGSGSDGQEGLYLYSDGVITRIVDTTTAAPGGTGTLSSFDDPALKGSVVVFDAQDSGGAKGLFSFTTAGGSPTVIANTATSVPDSEANFSSFFEQSADGDVVLFYAEDNGGQRGIYTSTLGVLARVADQSTLAPGGGGATFTSFSEPAARAGNLSFKGFRSDAGSGIYADFGDGLEKVADTDTAAPGTEGNFSSFDESSIEGEDVVFQGRQPDGDFGVYLRDFGVFSVIADDATSVPGGSGNFGFAGDPAQDGGLVVFAGAFDPVIPPSGDDRVQRGGSESGLYLFWIGDAGSLAKIIATGDELDGRIVDSIGVNPHEYVRDANAVFRIGFSDASSGIYRANILLPIFSDGFEFNPDLADTDSDG